MDDDLYDVVVTGRVRSGFEHQDVLVALKRIFKKPEGQSKVHTFLSGKPHAVRRKIARDTAQAYARHLHHIGIDVRVKRSSTANSVRPLNERPAKSTTNNFTHQSVEKKRSTPGQASGKDVINSIQRDNPVERRSSTKPDSSAKIEGTDRKESDRSASICEVAHQEKHQQLGDQHESSPHDMSKGETKLADMLSSATDDLSVAMPLGRKLKILSSAFKTVGITVAYFLVPVAIVLGVFAHLVMNFGDAARYPVVLNSIVYLLPLMLLPAAIWWLKPFLASYIDEPSGLPVAKNAQPLLWSALEGLAGLLKATLPAETRLSSGTTKGVLPESLSYRDIFKAPVFRLGLSSIYTLKPDFILAHIAKHLSFTRSFVVRSSYYFVLVTAKRLERVQHSTDSWDDRVTEKLTAYGKKKSILWEVYNAMCDGHRLAARWLQPKVDKSLAAIEAHIGFQGDLTVASLLGEAAAKQFIQKEADVLFAFEVASVLNTKDREGFMLAFNFPELVSQLADNPGQRQSLAESYSLTCKSPVNERIDNIEEFGSDYSAAIDTEKLAFIEFIRQQEHLAETITNAGYKKLYKYPLPFQVTDAETLLESVLDDSAQEQVAKSYFNNWQYGLGAWVLPDLADFPSDKDACKQRLNSVITRLRSITPDRNHLSEEAVLLADQVCRLNVARIAESFGDSYTVPGLENETRSTLELLKVKSERLQKCLDERVIYDEIMGNRIAFGIRLAGIRERDELETAYEALRQIAACQKILPEIRKHLLLVSCIEEKAHSKTYARYQPWLTKSDRSLDELMAMIFKIAKRVPYIWGHQHESLLDFMQAKIPVLSLSDKGARHRRAKLIVAIIQEANERLSLKLGHMLNDVERQAGIDPIRIQFKIDESRRSASLIQ